MQLLIYLYNLNVWLHFLPIILGGILFTLKRFPSFLLPIFFFCCAATASDLISVYCASRGIHTDAVNHGYSILEALILLLFFQGLIQSSRFQRMVPLLFDCIGLFTVVYSISVGLNKFPSVQIVVNTVMVIVLVLFYFYEVFYYEHMENLSTDSRFWIVSMLLISYVGNFALDLMTEQTITGDLSISVYYVNVILTIMTSFVFTFTLWMGRIRTT